MSKKWIDISVPNYQGMVHWPGDPAFETHREKSIDRGDVCNLTHISLSAHTGTHMDAPLHFLPGTKTMDDLPWDAVIGPARVVEIRDKEAIKPAELKKLKPRQGERLLFKTRNSAGSWKKPEFDKDFIYIAKEGAQYLVDCGVQTVGVDYLGRPTIQSTPWPVMISVPAGQASCGTKPRSCFAGSRSKRRDRKSVV